MKILFNAGLVGALAIGSLEAQTSTATENVATMEFNASVLTGGRSDLNGNVSGGAANNVVGPYIEPKLGLKLSNDQVDVAIEYKLEAWAGRGFGASNDERRMADNLRFNNAPNLFINGKFADNWSANIFAEMEHITNSGSQDEKNSLNLYLEPAIAYQINDSFSVAVAYYYERVNAMDSGISFGGGTDSAADDANPASRGFMVQQLQSVQSGNLYNLHTAKLASAWTINDRVSLESYVRGGRKFENNNRDGSFAYRIQNEVRAKATSDLSLRLRHRFDFEDVRKTSSNRHQQRLRLIGNYGLTDALAIYLENEGRYIVNKDAKDGFKNETKLGLLYTF